MKSDNKGI